MADRTPSSFDVSHRSVERVFERKVWRAKWAMVFEQIWLRICALLIVGGLFLLLSLLGLWQALPPLGHKIVLGAFAVAAGAAALSTVFIRWPTRSDAIRRIERVSDVPHRPASSYEDTLASQSNDPETRALWAAHRNRLAVLFNKLKVGPPRPRTDRYDPFALRALLLIVLATTLGFTGYHASDRIKTAFDFTAPTGQQIARLDAWISPPTYTSQPPIMLSDGTAPVASGRTQGNSSQDFKPVTVPEGSTLVVRVSGLGATKADVALFSSESFDDETTAQTIAAEKALSGGDVQEFRDKISGDSMIRVRTSGGELARWYVSVIPDKLPEIKLTDKPRGTRRGSMKLAYQVADDYGVTKAVAHFEDAENLPKPGSENERLDWPSLRKTRTQRPPLDMPLRVPGRDSKDGKAQTYLDFAPTPWAGRRVIMTLKATDVAGQTGTSPSIEIVLPEREFTKPLAKAVIEQRRKLFDDPDARRREVTLALNALTTDPAEFFDDPRVYLSLRSVYHRLKQSGAPEEIKHSIDQLWHTALRIEDGDLSDAERRVRDAQEKLAKALEEGASEEEIKKLMQELRQAMNDFMNQMAQQNQDQQRDFTQGNNQDQQSVNQNDINEMMRNIEELAKNGAREQAQKLLSEMRDLMERMQRGGQQNPQQARQQQQRMQALRKLDGMVGDQQQLMDDTFTEQRNRGSQPGQRMGQQRAPGQAGQQGQRGQQQRGQSQQNGMGLGQQQQQFGRGMQRGQRGQPGQRGQGQQGQMPSAEQLAERQRQLRDQLRALQRQLSEQGVGSPQQLDAARQAMENAEQALRDRNLPRAMEEQARALSNMQQGARSMAQEMMENSPQQFGNNGQERRDPLGRPQKSSGPELGTSVKVPDEIELQRAREIIEELRRRRGELTRPMLELDYLDRLLKRF